MKLKATVGAFALLGLGFSQFAGAQACPSIQGTLPQASGPQAVSGNNCNNNLAMTKICANGDTLGGGGIDVYQYTLGASHGSPIVFTLDPLGNFTPELATISTTCSSSTACMDDISGLDAVTPVSTADRSGDALGTYFVFVGNVADAACGAYSLSWTGPLPVKLENFSVN